MVGVTLEGTVDLSSKAKGTDWDFDSMTAKSLNGPAQDPQNAGADALSTMRSPQRSALLPWELGCRRCVPFEARIKGFCALIIRNEVLLIRRQRVTSLREAISKPAIIRSKCLLIVMQE